MNTAPLPLYLGHSHPVAHLHFDGTLALFAGPGYDTITVELLDKLFTTASTEGWHVTELKVIGADESETALIKTALAFQSLADGLSICFQELTAQNDPELDTPQSVSDLAGRAVRVGDTVAVIIRESGREDRLELRVVASIWLSNDSETVEVLAWDEAGCEDNYDYCAASHAVLVKRAVPMIPVTPAFPSTPVNEG